MSSLSQERKLNAKLMGASLIMNPTEIQDVISQFMKTLTYAPLPRHLLLPASSFRPDLEALLQRHLAAPPTGDVLLQDEQESALWSNPDLVFFDCRISQTRFETWSYNKSLGELKLLKGESGELDQQEGMDCVTVLPIYRIISLGYRKGIAENQVAVQSRSTNLIVWYDERYGIDWSEQKKGKDEERTQSTTSPNGWLGSETVELAQSPTANGSWVPYVRNLVGLTDIEPPESNTPITPIDLPLSSLIVLFLKCSNTETTSFLSVDSTGNWILPAVEGNQGEDQHLFYNATDEVTVRVV
jgi:hypothetical protein